jgi:proline racemase
MRTRKLLSTVDTHTAGGPTRIVTGGLPPLPGRSVAERMEYFREHHDPVRRLLLHEPRGHRDMYGAVLTPPATPDAQIGAFFMTAGGYLPACVHSSLGVAVAGLQTGFLQPPEAGGEILMDVPAGVVRLRPRMSGDRVDAVAIRTPPAFVHTPDLELDMGLLGLDRPVRAAVVFSGVFFVLVDVGEIGGTIAPEAADRLAAMGVRILEAANRTTSVSHPERPGPATIALAMIHEQTGPGSSRDMVIGAGGGIDRSPCGAGTAALVAWLHGEGCLDPGEDYRVESFLGMSFTGRVIEPLTVGSFDGVVPEVEGSAYVTGMHSFVLDPDDPRPEGFLF